MAKRLSMFTPSTPGAAKFTAGRLLRENYAEEVCPYDCD
jgi:hypothetical protein